MFIFSLHPGRQIERGNIRMGKVRKLIGKLVNGQLRLKLRRRRSSIKNYRFDFPSVVGKNTFPQRKNSLSSQSSTNSTKSRLRRVSASISKRRRSSNNLPKIEEVNEKFEVQQRRKISNETNSGSSQESEAEVVEKDPPCK